jgi:hypothetical protein
MDTVNTATLYELFRQLLPGPYLRQLGRQFGFCRRGIYSLRLVMWLMICQRLQHNASLAWAVRQLQTPVPRALLAGCKRVREGRISTATGGYCQARQKLPILAATQMVERIFQQLQALLQPAGPAVAAPVFLLDGSAVRLQARGDLPDRYPPGNNQHGQNHWPQLRLVVFHDAVTGLAMPPRWGPMNGPQACSEQQLAEEALGQLPPGAVVLGDRNFGIFAIAWAAQQRLHPVVLRLTASRARKLLGRPLQAGRDETVEWRPSRFDRRGQPNWPAEAALRGRLLIVSSPGAREPLLCLFTTLESPAPAVASLYELRWNVETDLRSLKQTLRLQMLTSKSVAMMEKELLVAVAAYNLVRAVMRLAADQAGVPSRRLSFTSVYWVVEGFLPLLLRAKTQKTRNRYLDQMVALAARYKLPSRRKKRSYPREVWGTGYRFPTRKA